MGEKLRTRFLTSMKCFNLPGERFGALPCTAFSADYPSLNLFIYR